MEPLQICIGPTIRIGRESWFLPYAGFFPMGKRKLLSHRKKAETSSTYRCMHAVHACMHAVQWHTKLFSAQIQVSVVHCSVVQFGAFELS